MFIMTIVNFKMHTWNVCHLVSQTWLAEGKQIQLGGPQGEPIPLKNSPLYFALLLKFYNENFGHNYVCVIMCVLGDMYVFVFLATHVCRGMHGFRLMSSVFLDQHPLSFGGTRYLHRTENSLIQLNCIVKVRDSSHFDSGRVLSLCLHKLLSSSLSMPIFFQYPSSFVLVHILPHCRAEPNRATQIFILRAACYRRPPITPFHVESVPWAFQKL